jgi:EmrB/QacA subfamily drug resistance transporter
MNDSSSATAPVEATNPGRTRVTALIVASSLLMQNLDGTVIATALPTMAHVFGVQPVHMNVAMTSYLLSLAVFIPASGWVADRFGSLNVFRAAIFVFTLGSILCGQASSLPFLVAARIVQGAGGAMMVPVGRLVLLRTAAKSELVGAMAWFSAPALIGPVIGPPVGGFLVTYLSWRWIFYINVPIGLIGIILVTLFVQDSREPAVARLDGIGLVLSAVSLSGIMFGLETAGRGLVPPPLALGMLGLGLFTGVLYYLHARHHPAPLLDFSLFRHPTFMVSTLSGTLFRVGVGAVPFLLPLMLQIGFGLSAAQSGMITFANAAGAIAMKPGTQWALRRFGFRDTLVVNGALAALFIALTAAFRPGWPIELIYLVLLIGGFIRSLQFTAYNTLAYADLPRTAMSAATSLYSTIQQVSLTLGITVGAAALEVSMLLLHNTQPKLADFSAAYLLVGFISLLAAPAAVFMPRDAGAELSGHTMRPAR